MDRERLIKRLMATFLEELGEHIEAMNRDVLALEKAAAPEERAEHLKALFRTAHSLKGAARSVNVGEIERVCHTLEGALAGAQAGKVALSPDLFAALFALADALEEAGMRLREQRDLSGSPLALLLPRLEAALGSPREGPLIPLTPQPAKPQAAEEAAPLAPPFPVPSAPPQAPMPPEAPSVRVAAEKLDAFLARSGALLVARRRAQARVEDVTVLREMVGRWRAEWQEVERPFRALLPTAPGRLATSLRRTGDNLMRLEKGLERLNDGMVADGKALKESAGALDEAVRRVRMLPFLEACQGLDRMVRDLAQAGRKEIELAVVGADVELDRSVLEGLRDPLRHLVRNAVDHGVEPAAERRSSGKPPLARITVSAVLRGAQVEVAVADDGRGLDLEALRRQLRKRGLADPPPTPDGERELARSIFLPGLSTSRLITDISGRGVGLDVVKSRAEGLHGAVDVSFTPGKGARFTLTVPLTLTTLRALLVVAGGQTFAFIDTNVQRLVRIGPTDLRSMEGRQMLALGGPPVPVMALTDALGLPGVRARPPERGSKIPAAIVVSGDRQVAFVVDELLTEQEVVVKGLGARVRRLPHVSGATLLPSGGLALVLNVANLVRTALGRAPAGGLMPLAQPAERPRKRLLVVDDSVTTRTLEKTILEVAGYEVAVAADGAAAWQLLQERGADLVVSDVDMPRMDGFAFTETVRGSRRFRDLPVVLVTARETEQDRARGAAVGANAYLVKSAFDQTNLLETIAQLV